jgi:hypothetical protein
VKAHRIPVLASLVLSLAAVSTFAQPPAGVRTEVHGLLQAVEHSGCEFGRNGTWHDSKAAGKHMRGKYDYLVARDMIASSEDFVERVGTKSSMSGQPYQVRCTGAAPLASGQWLRSRLAQLRAAASKVQP